MYLVSRTELILLLLSSLYTQTQRFSLNHNEAVHVHTVCRLCGACPGPGARSGGGQPEDESLRPVS